MQLSPQPSSKPHHLSNWHHDHKRHLSRGERAADRLRNGMGSWRFVFGFTAFMVVWAGLNSLGLTRHWDPYPYILLNLFLSMLAGLQGAILLIAAKRQDAINAVMAEHDYKTNLAAKAEIDKLMQQNDMQLAALADLRQQVADLAAATRR